jgi:uncharacterized protein YpmS
MKFHKWGLVIGIAFGVIVAIFLLKKKTSEVSPVTPVPVSPEPAIIPETTEEISTQIALIQGTLEEMQRQRMLYETQIKQLQAEIGTD